MRKAFGIARFAAAAFGVVSLISLLIYNLGFSGPVVSNFLSYFTMESAIAAVVIWVIGGVIALRHPSDPQWLVTARMIVTCYQIVSGIVFSIIVIEAATHNYTMVVPWSNKALHYWLTAYAIVDWLVAPGRRPVLWKALRLILIVPILWGAYTIIRGIFVRWYPYFFLDPTQVSLGESIIYCTVAAALIVAIGAVLSALSMVLPPSAKRIGVEIQPEHHEPAPSHRPSL